LYNVHRTVQCTYIVQSTLSFIYFNRWYSMEFIPLRLTLRLTDIRLRKQEPFTPISGPVHISSMEYAPPPSQDYFPQRGGGGGCGDGLGNIRLCLEFFPVSLNYIYAPMIYTAPRVISSFLGTKWHSPIGSRPCPNNSQFPGPNPLPLDLVKDAARIKSITHGAV
jgi:hypothetical protein